MKQLKFMLAAATAVGIAAVAQAATQTNYLFGDDTPTDTFEGADKDTLGRTLTGWSYSDPANAEQDDDSRVALDGEDKVLNVNTGTKPLLRALWQGDNGARPVSLADVQSLYIDTMVQFTVTPDGDPVTAGDGDKLMIYLQEVPAEGETPASTKLMVKAANYVPGGETDEGETTLEQHPATDVAVVKEDGTSLEVSANVWYNLKVTSFITNGVPVFNIFVGGVKLYAPVALYRGITDKSVFPSLLGTESTTLTHVGFAGEGMVDDLTVATITEQTSVDFTFTLSWGDGISAVTYTIAGDVTGAKTPENGKAFTVPGTGSFTISYELDGWYTLNDANPTLSYDFAPNGSGSLNLATTKLTSKVDSSGNVVVNPDASASDVGINSDSAFADADAEKLGEVLTWAKNASVTVDQINKMTFSEAGDPAGATDADKLVEEAYLLNCTTAEVENKKKSFKISADDLAKLLKEGTLTELDVDSNLYNGKVVIEGRDDLSEGTWEITEQGNSHKFYRARLVFPTK